MKEKSTFNLLGCCVIRDAFRIGDIHQKYKVLKFYQFTNPISFCQKSKIRLAQEDFTGWFDWANFIKKCVCADINKTVLDDIAATPSDFLLIDLCELRFKNCKLNLQGEDEFLVTQTKYINEIIENKDFLRSVGVKSYSTDLELSEQETIRYLDEFVRRIKQYYDEKQIVLVKNLPVWRHLNDQQHCFEEFWIPAITKMRNALEKYYEYLQKRMPDIHVISMPEYVLGDSLHLWGKDSLHFVDEYYKYLFAAIDIITGRHADEISELQELQNIYSRYFYNLDKLKRFEYYMAAQRLPDNILFNGDLNVSKEGRLNEWKNSCSKDSVYIAQEKTLKCGNEVKTWAVILQKIASDRVRGKKITFTIDFETDPESMLNMAIRCKEGNEKIYLMNKQINSYGERKTYSVTVDFPADLDETNETEFMLYINKPLHQAKIYRVKAEEGEVSTMF